MTLFQILTSTWHLEPWVLATSILLIAGYCYATQAELSKHTIIFLAGVAVFFLTLSSPLTMLGRTYLFSANMVQHITLLLIVPLLLLLGIPPSLIERMSSRSGLKKPMKILGHPLVAWFFGVGAMWIWHLPSLHDAALRNESAEDITIEMTPAITRPRRPTGRTVRMTLGMARLGFILGSRDRATNPMAPVIAKKGIEKTPLSIVPRAVCVGSFVIKRRCT